MTFSIDDIVARCPKFCKVMTDQKLDEETFDWDGETTLADKLLSAMGRGLYKNGQFDLMQFAPWLFGESGTGKAVVRKILQSCYDSSLRNCAVPTRSENWARSAPGPRKRRRSAHGLCGDSLPARVNALACASAIARAQHPR